MSTHWSSPNDDTIRDSVDKSLNREQWQIVLLNLSGQIWWRSFEAKARSCIFSRSINRIKPPHTVHRRLNLNAPPVWFVSTQCLEDIYLLFPVVRGNFNCRLFLYLFVYAKRISSVVPRRAVLNWTPFPLSAPSLEGCLRAEGFYQRV